MGPGRKTGDGGPLKFWKFQDMARHAAMCFRESSPDLTGSLSRRLAKGFLAKKMGIVRSTPGNASDRATFPAVEPFWAARAVIIAGNIIGYFGVHRAKPRFS
jgi:hypothetical protein